MIKAEVVLASSSPYAKPLYTLKTRYPWFIHGEVMTHRVLSRNASSNRAIPLRKMLEEARSDDLRAEPVFWGAEQKGMSPGSELPSKYDPNIVVNSYNCIEHALECWREAALNAARSAEILGNIGLHKSLCNRLLMPFTHANVIITAVEWDNFFGLRLDKAADPTMRGLAEAMWIAINEAPVQTLEPGEWHLPFCNDVQGKRCTEDDDAIKVSVARCARVSYESHETGKRSTIEEDLKLYERLVGVQPLHASPAEHQATPDSQRTQEAYVGSRLAGMPEYQEWVHHHEHGNFVGWCQYRKMLAGEAQAPLPTGYRWKDG